MNQNTNNLPKKERITLKQGRSWFGLSALAATLVIALILQVRQWILSVMPSSETKSSAVSLVDTPESIVSRVQGHVILPSGMPVVEQITDIVTARSVNPTFYQDLQKGDWILRYPSIVIVYRLMEDRVVRVRDAVGSRPPALER